jgi:hypothetical protein
MTFSRTRLSSACYVDKRDMGAFNRLSRGGSKKTFSRLTFSVLQIYENRTVYNVYTPVSSVHVAIPGQPHLNANNIIESPILRALCAQNG